MGVFRNIRKIGFGAEQPDLTGCEGAFLKFASKYNEDECIVLPGFCDVHVHFREPGFSYKETVLSGAQAAAASGCTAVCTMPNVNPIPDCAAHLQPQLKLAQVAPVRVLPYGSVTVGERGAKLSAMEELAPDVVAFSDDGVGVADDGLMREAMQRCRALGKLIAGHCEDMRYSDPREREWREVERNIRLADETGCAFHVCHVSTKESVSLIRDAKRSGVDLSCETAPHYLLLNRQLIEDAGNFKMNPPIHELEDQAALLEALTDGTIDMIATDHAPHSPEEKSRGFVGSLNGVVGLETAFPTLYSSLVLEGILQLEQLVSLMSKRPRARFNIPSENGFSVWNLAEAYTIDPSEFRSMGKSTPFEGWSVQGRCLLTSLNGKLVFIREES